MPYTDPVGDYLNVLCSLCGKERVVYPQCGLIACEMCDAEAVLVVRERT